ncbi:hypothetical protein MNB_SUP05-SYMBIONT-4-1301 [hydrothermal vent metagenome]|uniref:Uncharacterized protein n=1 Tax=hydrothermal vent metagenome TaxID=652676 RepID=A0A1W1DXM0_9ZZZZ
MTLKARIIVRFRGLKKSRVAISILDFLSPPKTNNYPLVFSIINFYKWYKPVLNSVNERSQASSNNKHYTQKKVDADHFFNDKDELLINEVSTWLK